MKTEPAIAKYPQVGFQCFVDRKLVNFKAVLRRKFFGKFPSYLQLRDVICNYKYTSYGQFRYND